METSVECFSAGTPADLIRLRGFVAARGPAALRALDQHLARPRYRPAFTRIAERAGQIVGYALIGHRRLRLGAATLEAGHIAALGVGLAQEDPGLLAALLGDCLSVLVEEALPLVLMTGPAEKYAPFGFAHYCLDATARLASRSSAHEAAPRLRRATEDNLDDLAALHEACYHELPLAEIYARPDWRFRLASDEQIWAIDDRRGRLIAYCSIAQTKDIKISEAAAADAGAARALCSSLQAYAHIQAQPGLHMILSPWHPVAQAALQLNGDIHLVAPADSTELAYNQIAGVVDLPLLLEALAPEFEQRLARSRYATWSGNLRLEIETERITLAFEAGRATVIDGSRPADLRLRQVTLPALAQLCLGYRVAADLRATGGLACDDSALGLLDALFPAVLATAAGAEG